MSIMLVHFCTTSNYCIYENIQENPKEYNGRTGYPLFPDFYCVGIPLYYHHIYDD